MAHTKEQHEPTILNRQAHHDYFVEESLEAGIVLTGTEIKSIRQGKATLQGAYVMVSKGEVWLEGMHIAPYDHGTYMNHEPLRSRKLLVHHKEIEQLTSKVKAKGMTLIPLKAYFKHNRVKIEIGVCRGKKQYDKRDDIARRDAERDIARAMRRG